MAFFRLARTIQSVDILLTLSLFRLAQIIQSVDISLTLMEVAGGE